jgi:hypothetical protein
MSKKSNSAMSLEKEVQSLRKEFDKLQKKVLKLEAQSSKARTPGKMRATKLTVDALEVRDPNGNVVASIDNKGNLFCLTVWASTGKNTRGVFIDGKTFRKISANSLELIGPTGNKPGLEATNWPSGVVLHLLDPQTKQRLSLQSSGAPIISYDRNGKQAAMLEVNSPAGGKVSLLGTDAGSKAAAQIGVSHLTRSGSVIVTDDEGGIIGELP